MVKTIAFLALAKWHYAFGDETITPQASRDGGSPASLAAALATNAYQVSLVTSPPQLPSWATMPPSVGGVHYTSSNADAAGAAAALAAAALTAESLRSTAAISGINPSVDAENVRSSGASVITLFGAARDQDAYSSTVSTTTIPLNTSSSSGGMTWVHWALVFSPIGVCIVFCVFCAYLCRTESYSSGKSRGLVRRSDGSLSANNSETSVNKPKSDWERRGYMYSGAPLPYVAIPTQNAHLLSVPTYATQALTVQPFYPQSQSVQPLHYPKNPPVYPQPMQGNSPPSTTFFALQVQQQPKVVRTQQPVVLQQPMVAQQQQFAYRQQPGPQGGGTRLQYQVPY